MAPEPDLEKAEGEISRISSSTTENAASSSDPLGEKQDLERTRSGAIGEPDVDADEVAEMDAGYMKDLALTHVSSYCCCQSTDGKLVLMAITVSDINQSRSCKINKISCTRRRCPLSCKHPSQRPKQALSNKNQPDRAEQESKARSCKNTIVGSG